MARRFREGDKIRCVSMNDNYMRQLTIGEIYTVGRNHQRDNWLYIIEDRETHDYETLHFVLVEREYSLDTLIKRANLGLRSLEELKNKYLDDITIETSEDTFATYNLDELGLEKLSVKKREG